MNVIELNILFLFLACSLPVFLNETSLDNGTRSVEYEDSFELECSAEGLPQPSIIWYYNDKEITELLETGTIDHGRISLTEGNKTLKFVHATEAENGNYSCKAINRLGSVWAHSIIIVASPKVNRLWPWVIVFTIFIIFFLSVIIIILYQRVKHERALLRELTKTVLETFDDGAEGDLNPELGIVEQADLLPYKKQYEFPRENLRLGKQLGSGAFGVVLKGEANGILKDNEVTAVAVKMLKQNVDVSHIKALTTELKVMIHLGKHLNVVNLLGACTRNLNNRELLVIVEYCRYGNMHDYLRRNRNNFINQINPKTGLFDSNLIGTRITESERRRLFPTQSTSSYTGATHSDSSVTFYSNCTIMTDLYSNQQAPSSRLVHNYKNLAIDPLDEEDDYIVSKDLLPALKPQSKGEHEFCTEDLLCWSFQTACGMEYLASRKVLHGDLAARNILLAENNIIKICDFGMSKNMHYEDNYCKKGKQLLPVKWLSIEAMRDREFSVYSDIWSFGVVLWEFFSLARTPYPGLEGVQELYKKLESGYRMERPVFAPDIVYRIMLECWSEDPKRRPPFSDLTARLGYMIDRDVQKYFLDLSEQMAKSNEEDEDEGACLIQPLNMEYQNLIKKDIESSKDKKQTKDKKTVKEVELLELKPAPQNGVDPKSDQCGFSNQTYGNVDLERNVRTEEILLV
ncbi:vascular endothelial growth factor receptor 2 [Nilaparvata lugens]|uniref:vascular endothelial growth factor receptor 2 n=1 Tax=Nilaparvata lugens TaxID=108931 RepID=UPI00193E34D5|nr:vascular endothelial growth factor receptor 2 [Nilaparvata lugens]